MNTPGRPHVIVDERYPQPVPRSPYDLPSLPPHGDIDSASSYLHSTLPRCYFDMGRSGPYLGVRPGSPTPCAAFRPRFGPSGFGSSYFEPLNTGAEIHSGLDSSYVFHQGSQSHMEEIVRKSVSASLSKVKLTDHTAKSRTNLAVQLVNGQISHTARYAQLQPKMCRNGRFPNDFRVPRTVEEMKAMDSSTIERILLGYQLPTDARSFRLSASNSIPANVSKKAKLCTLFDFVGATRLADHERLIAEQWKRKTVSTY